MSRERRFREMAPSLEGLAPFQIAFVVRDIERAAREFDACLAAGPWRGWLFGPQGQVVSTVATRPSGHCAWR